ncbi:MAG: hypothetical protein VCC04_10045, partial [Myxococcota bacterium]
INDCQAGTAPTLTDNVPCTDDSCDEVGDTIVNAAEDANCDDGDICTADACDQFTGCSNTPIEGCAAAVPALSPRGLAIIVLGLLASGAIGLSLRRRDDLPAGSLDGR